MLLFFSIKGTTTTTTAQKQIHLHLSRAVRVITTDSAYSEKEIRKSLNGIRTQEAVLERGTQGKINRVELEYELAN